MKLGETDARTPSPDHRFPYDGFHPFLYDTATTGTAHVMPLSYADKKLLPIQLRRAKRNCWRCRVPEDWLGWRRRPSCSCKKRINKILGRGGFGAWFSPGGAGVPSVDAYLDYSLHNCNYYLNNKSTMLQCFKPLVPHLALFELYETTPIRSLGRLTEAYLLTRQARVDRTTHGASRVSCQAAASPSSQAQLARHNSRSEDLAPRATNVEQQQGQQGRAASGPRAFQPNQPGSGSLHEKRFDDDGRQWREDERALSGKTMTHNSLAGSGRGAGVDGGTIPWDARKLSRGESGGANSQALAFVDNARLKSEVLTDDSGNATVNFERGTEMHGTARDRRPIWMTTSTENQPRNRHTIRDDAGCQVNRSVCRLRRLNGKAIGLSMLSFLALGVSADEVHHRAAKVATTAVSALVSFGTGMTSLQLEADSSAGGTSVAKMCLRMLSSTSLLALIGCFMHWFCAGAERTKRFISAAFAVLFFGWVLTRVVATPSAGDVVDTFTWLEKVNLFGLLAAVAGIINVRTDGVLRAEIDAVLGSGTSANPLLPLSGNGGPGASQALSGGEGSGEGRPQSESDDSAV